MNRFTFVVQVQPDGPWTLENLSTHERIRVDDMNAVGPQIDVWLTSLEKEREAMPDSANKKGSTDEQQRIEDTA